MAFLLSGAPFHYNDLTIGLFGLVGAAGALCANFAGRWADRRWTKPTTLVFALLIALSFVPLWLGRTLGGADHLGILVLDVGVQGMQVTNQSLIYRLAPHARSRINSAYMGRYFVGGALGSVERSLVYEHAHWTGVCVLGAALGWSSHGARARGPALARTTPHPQAERRLATQLDWAASVARPVRQHPTGPREVAGVAVGVAARGSPGARARPPRTHRPAATSVTTRPGQSPDASTSAMVSSATRRCSSFGIEDRRAIARPDVVALAIDGRRVVDLEEELQDLAVTRSRWDRR